MATMMTSAASERPQDSEVDGGGQVKDEFFRTGSGSRIASG
jgi:hypothetical protein